MSPFCVPFCVLDAKFSPDGKQFAQARWNNEVCVFDPRTGEETHSFEGHAGSATTLDFSPDGKRLISGGDDGIVRLWNLDPDSPGLVLSLSGHRDSVRYVAFSADGDAIASVSIDGDARVWTIASELEDSTLLFALISRCINQELFDDAPPLLEKLVTEVWVWDDESRIPMQLGVLYAYLGDSKHAQYSREYLQRYASTQDPNGAERSAKTYLVTPGPHDPQLLEQAVLLARRSTELGKDSAGFKWFALCRGIAEYRVGAHAVAIEWLSKVDGIPIAWATALAYQSMAEFRLGHTEVAKRLLQEVEADLAQRKLEGGEWHNLLIARMAVDEAKAMILDEANQ